MMICSPLRLRRRVLLMPMYSTLPRKSPTIRKSPTTKGRSRVMDSEANKSPRMFCTAKRDSDAADAEASDQGGDIDAEIVEVSSSTIAQMTTLTMKLMMPSEPAAARSAARLR